jgi:hypothetical protein
MANRSLYAIFTRVWLGERARQPGRPATFDRVPDAFLLPDASAKPGLHSPAIFRIIIPR